MRPAEKPNPGDMAMVTGGVFAGRIVHCSELYCRRCGNCKFCIQDWITVDAPWIPRTKYSREIPPAAPRKYLMKINPDASDDQTSTDQPIKEVAQ